MTQTNVDKTIKQMELMTQINVDKTIKKQS